jgi:hypothetical protein
MAKKDPHLQFQKWAQEYGPVYSLMLGTKTMIVLSSDQAVKDLLDKKSANYSARPDLYTAQTLMSGDKRMVLMVRIETRYLDRKAYQGADVWIAVENYSTPLPQCFAHEQIYGICPVPGAREQTALVRHDARFN